MKRILIAGVLSLACVAGAAGAQQEPSPSAAEIVAARQAAFAMSAATLGSIKTVLDSDRPIDGLAFTAGGLNRWATALPSMFPAGTGPDAIPTTRAKSEIWSDRAGFEAKAAEYQAATARLRDAVTAGDRAAANEAWTAARATCGSCHDAYRS
jgi:cytochrome c556